MSEYCEKHDARYDKENDMWLEENCGSETCDYCKDRPNHPSEVKEE